MQVPGNRLLSGKTDYVACWTITTQALGIYLPSSHRLTFQTVLGGRKSDDLGVRTGKKEIDIEQINQFISCRPRWQVIDASLRAIDHAASSESAKRFALKRSRYTPK